MNQEIVTKIVKASGAAPGELILIHFWGEDSDRWIADLFMEAAAEAGASPAFLQQSRTKNRELFLRAQDTCFDQKYFDMLSHFDAVLDVFTYQPVVLGSEIKAEKFEIYRKYMSQLFQALMKCRRFTQIRVPTEANAGESGLEARDYISRMTKAYDVDYPSVLAECKAKCQELSQSDSLTLHTGENCSLNFDLSGREWHIDAGDGDLPCGEVYIAPIENQTQGSIYFERLYIEDCGAFNKVQLSVENGQIISSNHEQVNCFLNELSPQSKVICEFGVGMNPNVTDLCGYTVLDEKMAGTFHIAIGNNTMFGGTNEAPVHLDFVGTGQILQ
ncbi:aminopeptidase [Cuneatibacter caecimuris]|uniref:Leucyl aminopeptidase (Aminopeptidase T) n=1 Tax=Cuneatibacter caecimuris TaxID=1796618 RepID=A0A4Q7PIN2_9FIRM|nr:aminopeptidase [Cuneatibacter caecimuris]RZT00484.1 leucyl aminopeptidase (aminopeptidase T) [Cuneatibacter caecimuris]